MKKILAFILAAMLLTASASAIDLYVDFGRLNAQTPPTVVDGRTLVPVRAIFEALGAAVDWDAAARTATGTTSDTTVIIQIDQQTAYVNGEAKTLDVPAQLINGSTMVPARFISEALGYDVTWYQPTQTAAVAYKLKGRNFYTSESEGLYHFDPGCSGNTYGEVSFAEVMGRGLRPCADCVPVDIAAAHYETPQPEPNDGVTAPPVSDSGSTAAAVTPAPDSGVGGGSTGNGNNFNTYNNASQQNTTVAYVLNTNTKKFHKPSCRSVKKIAAKNYATSSSSRDSIISQGYSPCKICNP